MRIIFGVLLICAVMLLGVLGPASAAPSFRGYTGLINIPTADSLSMRDYNAAIFFEQGDNDSTVLAGNLGVFPGLEVGVAHFMPEHGSSETVTSAKFCFKSEGTISPKIAIGVADITDAIDCTPYIVLSKSLTPVGRQFLNPVAHVGVGSGMLDGVFAGISADINKRATLMLEYDTNDVNLGAGFAISPEVRIHAAVGGFSDFGIGISYNKKL